MAPLHNQHEYYKVRCLFAHDFNFEIIKVFANNMIFLMKQPILETLMIVRKFNTIYSNVNAVKNLNLRLNTSTLA